MMSDFVWFMIHCNWRERVRLLRGQCLYCGKKYPECID